MVRPIKAKDRYHHQTDWLSTYWHFSFDHFWDPANVSFGALRVFNDDVIQPSERRGFRRGGSSGSSCVPSGTAGCSPW
jgi:redox-sensitive bicupin YhaK (pirin superfamily)